MIAVTSDDGLETARATPGTLHWTIIRQPNHAAQKRGCPRRTADQYHPAIAAAIDAPTLSKTRTKLT